MRSRVPLDAMAAGIGCGVGGALLVRSLVWKIACAVGDRRDDYNHSGHRPKCSKSAINVRWLVPISFDSEAPKHHSGINRNENVEARSQQPISIHVARNHIVGYTSSIMLTFHTKCFMDPP